MESYMNHFTQLKYNSRILIINHDMTIHFIARELLPSHNIEVELAVDAQFAMVLLSQRQFDCIIIEASQPDMDGFQMCEAIRHLKLNKTTPIIMTHSRRDEKIIRVKALESGAQDCFRTPLNWTAFATAIKMLSVQVGTVGAVATN
jgi:DNA-binding response OmpR family regulator